MKFTEIKLRDARVITIEPIEDERGFIARSYCVNEFARQGIEFTCVQCNISYNKKRGTLRGMHFQRSPHEESKIVTCIKGSVFDVIIDIRPDSPTYKQWFSIELSAKNRVMLLVPKGFAHGFQTLEDEVELSYMMSEVYHPGHSGGIRWNDPAFAISWPFPVTAISARDQSYPFVGA